MNTTDRHTPRLLAVALAVLLVAPAAAQVYEDHESPEPRYSPAVYDDPTISVLEAVRTALVYDPALELSRLGAEERLGRVQESLGLFDSGVILDSFLEHTRRELTAVELASQVQRRDLFRIPATILQDIADDMREQLEAGQPFAYADCPRGTDFTIGGTPICISGRERATLDLFTGLIEGFGSDDLQQEYINLGRRASENTIDVLRSTAFALREGLRRLGTQPEVDEATTFSLDLRYTKLFRNGWRLSPGVILETTANNFEGKPKDPAFGGKGVPDAFTGVLGIVLDIPLGKGGGRVSAEAPLRAARLNHQASLNSYAFSASETARDTLLAYWGLVAAQERLDVLTASATRQERFLELAQGLIDAEELAAADINQVHARLADVRAFAAQGRQAVLQSRIDLALIMGLDVNELADTPLASDTFPETPSGRELDALQGARLASTGLKNRNDLEASRRLEESARVLADAARNDLKRIFDLTFSLGYSGLYEGGSMGDPAEFFKGIHEAYFGGLVGPSAQVFLTVEWPFANNAAKGQLAQAESSSRTSIIQRRDLERVITDRTQELVGALRKAVAEIGRRAASVERYRQSLEFETEKFRLGEATAVDLILTEERQTSALLSLIGAQQVYMTLLTELRHELGTLVTGRIDAGQIVIEKIDPTGLEFAARPG
jgi:outer membrane protein TolC